MKQLKNKSISVLLNIATMLISITCIFPLIWLAYNSVKDKFEFMKDTISLPADPQWGNFWEAIQLGNLIPATFNTVFNSVINVILVCLGSIIVGYFLERYEFRGKKIISAIFLVGMVIPLYSLLVPMFLQYKVLGMLNTRFVLILPYFAMQISLGILLCKSFVHGIPKEIEEASCNRRMWNEATIKEHDISALQTDDFNRGYTDLLASGRVRFCNCFKFRQSIQNLVCSSAKLFIR